MSGECYASWRATVEGRCEAPPPPVPTSLPTRLPTGWCQALSRLLHGESEIFILSEREVGWRTEQFAIEGLHIAREEHPSKRRVTAE